MHKDINLHVRVNTFLIIWFITILFMSVKMIESNKNKKVR